MVVKSFICRRDDSIDRGAALRWCKMASIDRRCVDVRSFKDDSRAADRRGPTRSEAVAVCSAASVDQRPSHETRARSQKTTVKTHTGECGIFASPTTSAPGHLFLCFWCASVFALACSPFPTLPMISVVVISMLLVQAASSMSVKFFLAAFLFYYIIVVCVISKK